MFTQEQYIQVRDDMKKASKKKHWSKLDLRGILIARETGDWSSVYETKLYKEYGGEYCALLEVVAWVFKQ